MPAFSTFDGMTRPEKMSGINILIIFVELMVAVHKLGNMDARDIETVLPFSLLLPLPLIERQPTISSVPLLNKLQRIK